MSCVCYSAKIRMNIAIYYSKLVLEGELAKLRGHYTQVNDERNQLKRIVDEKDNEIQKLVKEKTTLVKDHSDTMELMRNQIQQYARDYEDERVGRENLVKQIVKLEASNKEKDEEIDQLQDKLTKFTGIMIRPDVSRDLLHTIRYCSYNLKLL